MNILPLFVVMMVLVAIIRIPMNFIFFSIHFPDINTDFSYHLRQFGANVLGIGDTDYHDLNDRLKSTLTEYYRVNNLEDYDEILRAVGYFTHKYGKIDRFESLNEHWLEIEARVRTDFNITGMKMDEVEDIRRKSRMKLFFEKAGVNYIPYSAQLTRSKVREFISKYGYPIIIKPDKGYGAQMTYKVSNEEDVAHFFRNHSDGVDFIAEEFIDGITMTYDGLVDQNGTILFESGTVCEKGIMEFVNDDDHAYYISIPSLPKEVKQAGKKIIKAFKARERFFHVEMFKSRKNGEIYALEINMRPPGAWVTDAINFVHDIDIYQEWARMVVNGKVDGPFNGKYFTGYSSRKRHKNYRHDHDTIVRELDGKLVKHAPIPAIFSRAMGHYAYQFRAKTMKEVQKMIEFIHQEDI
jgi:hypothetical protein